MCIIEKVKTIYDLVVFAYMQVHDNRENTKISEYFMFQSNNTDNTWKEIGSKFRELLNNNLFIDEFIKEIKKLDKDLLTIYWVHFLVEFDNFYKEKEKYCIFNEYSYSSNLRCYKGNNNISREYMFYPRSGDNFVIDSDVMVSNSIRYHKIREGILEHIHNYTIVNFDNIKKSVELYQYMDRDEIKEILEATKEFTFAIVPFANKQWFEKIEDSGIVINDLNDKTDEINNGYIYVINELENIGVNAIIFPELAINKDTIKKVKKFLCKSCINDEINNVKLIFMGSRWENKRNICTLITSTGREIISNDKMNAYVGTNKYGKPILERLENVPDIIRIIDINGFGRLYYLICKDALDSKKMEIMHSDYGVNISVISAYSKSVSDFKNRSEHFSNTYKSVTFMSNSCAVRPREKDIGFISYPVCSTDDKTVKNRMKSYYCDTEWEECEYCKCAKVFKFYLDQEEEENGLSGVKVECINVNI